MLEEPFQAMNEKKTLSLVGKGPAKDTVVFGREVYMYTLIKIFFSQYGGGITLCTCRSLPVLLLITCSVCPLCSQQSVTWHWPFLPPVQVSVLLMFLAGAERHVCAWICLCFGISMKEGNACVYKFSKISLRY